MFGLTYRARKGRFGVTFESIGDETSGVFESHFLAFLQGVFPKIISRSVDITACVPRREPQYSYEILAKKGENGNGFAQDSMNLCESLHPFFVLEYSLISD